MKTIKKGSIYFIREDSLTECKIIGATKAVPVIVVREPQPSEEVSTVTVVPIMAKHRGMVYKMDRVDNTGHYAINKNELYRAVPSLITTVKVSALGRYIGSLDDFEYQDIMMHCIMQIAPDWFMSKYPMLGKGITRQLEANDIEPDESKEVEFTDTLTIKKCEVTCSGSRNKIAADIAPLDKKLETVADPRIAQHENWMKPGVTYFDPVVAGFPKSMFFEEDLRAVASKFKIDLTYYYMTKEQEEERYRLVSALTEEELNKVKGFMSDYRFENTIMELYGEMTAFDREFLAVWLPTRILCDILCSIMPVDNTDAYAIKLICSILYGLTEDEYLERLTDVSSNRKEEKLPDDLPFTFGSEETEEEESDDTTAVVEENNLIPNPTEIDDMRLDRIKPYLSEGLMSSIPKKYAKDFLAVPKYKIRRYYMGKLGNFEPLYADVRKVCEKYVSEDQQN